MSQETQERLLDLLEKRAFYGLSPDEQRELDQLSGADDISLDLTASAINLAELVKVEPMPTHLRSKVENDADVYFKNRVRALRPIVRDSPAKAGSNFWAWFGWAIAAAACIALVANIYLTRTNRPDLVGIITPTPTPALLTPEQMRQQLLSNASDLARADIGPGKMANIKPSGEIVWSDAKQAGYIHVTGLPKNDPTKEQYQLWIFDENQDPKTPVDGGVFDVTADGEVTVPINAKLKIKNPQVFAITIEKPGGVVVSKQEKVASLAKRET